MLLCSLMHDDEEETRVVRYFGSIEVQIIKFNKIGIPFYSSGYDTRYIGTKQKSRHVRC